MALSENRLCQLAEEVAHTEDPLRALELLVGLRAELEAVTRAQVARGLRAGCSFGDVAGALGISRQAAHRRYRDLAPVSAAHEQPQLTLTADAQRVLSAASEAAGRGRLGGEHVLVAVMGCGGYAARALQRQGVTLAEARGRLSEMQADRRPSAFARPAGGAGKVLRDAARVAIARGERQIAVEALLLGALSDAAGGAQRLLGSLGVSVPAIRSALTREPEDAEAA